MNAANFRDFDRLGVGGKNDILVAHLHFGGEESQPDR
jgi:hypothetical protein